MRISTFRSARALRIALPAALAVAGIGLTAPLVAQDAQLPGVADAGRVAAGSYTVDPAHTLVGWRVDHFGFNDYFGIFGNVTGTLDIALGRVRRAEGTPAAPRQGWRHARFLRG